MGVTEEEEVRDVDVEAACEGRNEVVPLPDCVGTHAVDEEEVGLGVLVGFGGPAVHDGAVAEICGRGFEARVGEGEPVAPVTRGSEAETPCCHVVVVAVEDR